LLLDGTRFPKNGELYESISEIEVSYQIHFKAPFTGGGSGTLPKGVVVEVIFNPAMKDPIGVAAKPIEYEWVERILIPKDDLANSKYGGYSITISTQQLNEKFKLVAT
jgi:hypothetical protein